MLYISLTYEHLVMVLPLPFLTTFSSLLSARSNTGTHGHSSEELWKFDNLIHLHLWNSVLTMISHNSIYAVSTEHATCMNATSRFFSCKKDTLCRCSKLSNAMYSLKENGGQIANGCDVQYAVVKRCDSTVSWATRILDRQMWELNIGMFQCCTPCMIR